LMALFAITAVSMSFTGFSEPGFEKYRCSLHNSFSNSVMIDSNDRGFCVFLFESGFVALFGNHTRGKTAAFKTIHVPEHCVTLDAFY